MPFEDAGPPIQADQNSAVVEVQKPPIVAGGMGPSGGVAGGPVPLGTPVVFPFWAVL